ncbi:MAG: 23S rRNA pseudouridine synthase F, partial [Clostridium sp.]|nr:23S rRNA pseudouridine synthase F [Clostridium sp.]
IMNLCLGNLKTGESRKVTPEEYRELTRLLKDSTSLPVRHGGQ